jgi:hypothetical protein
MHSCKIKVLSGACLGHTVTGSARAPTQILFFDNGTYAIQQTGKV